jgi:hypothetical protein
MTHLTLEKKTLIGAAGAIVLVVVLFLADALLSRPDRIAHVRRTADLVSIRDAILRFQNETGRLPVSLSELVPAYLRADMLTEDGRTLYSYDRRRRTIAMARPSQVRGVVTRSRDAVVMDLPKLPREALLRLAAEQRRRAHTPAPPRPAPAPADPGRKPLPESEIPDAEPPLPLPPPPPPAMAKDGLVFPAGPRLEPPRRGTYVFEAEHYSETNYGWEVRLDSTAAGGAYIRSKEGIANGMGQQLSLIADFYNVGEKREYTYLKYHFNVPESGHYRVFGRFWTTGTHCSNCVIVGVDRDPLVSKRMGDRIEDYAGASMRNGTPFRWMWTPVADGGHYLRKGDHYIHIFLHEDGERLDQIALTRSYLSGQTPYAANLLPNASTAFRQRAPRPVRLTFDLKSVVMSSHLPPEASIAVRKIRPLEGDGRLIAALADAGPNGEEVELGSWNIDFAALPELAFVPIDFSRIDFDTLPRREFLLTARLSSHGEEIASARQAMMHPFEWEIAGPLPYYVNGMPGPLDEDAERPGIAWKPLLDTSFDHWGVMDFGVHVGKPSLHAPPHSTAYARTRIRVPRTDEYLLKIQSDDQMLLWIDGRLILRHDINAPVTRSAARPVVRLEKGDHDVRMRVNNGGFTDHADGRWQATLRFRTTDDRLTDITGQ